MASADLSDVLLVDTYDRAPVNMAAFRPLNPFYVWSAACLDVPGSLGRAARSVESVWQGLKLIDGATDEAQFDGRPYKRPSDDARRGDSAFRYQGALFSYDDAPLPLRAARFLIYAVVYLELLDRVVDIRLIDEIRAVAGDGGRVAFFDWDANGDIADTRSSFAHSALLAAWFAGDLERFLFEPARRWLDPPQRMAFEAAAADRLHRYDRLHRGVA